MHAALREVRRNGHNGCQNDETKSLQNVHARTCVSILIIRTMSTAIIYMFYFAHTARMDTADNSTSYWYIGTYIYILYIYK